LWKPTRNRHEPKPEWGTEEETPQAEGLRGKPIPKFGERRKERRREEKRARTANSNADPTPKPTGKRCASSSLELSTEVGNKGVPQPKRTKITGGSYAAVASNLPRVVLTCGDYLGGRMPNEVVGKMQKAVVGKILTIEEGAFVPRFAESFPRSGSLVFVCQDKDSETWLVKTANELDLGVQDLKVRVVAPEELRVTKVMTWLPEGVMNALDFLKLVQRQNGGVDVGKWAVLKETLQGCLILGLDEPSADTLKGRKLRLAAGVGMATFKLLNQKTAEKPGKEAKEEARRSEQP
jgi:hypothetical protein